MVRAFSGYLATDQLLLLWDRILGYNSLEILAGKRIIFTKTCEVCVNVRQILINFNVFYDEKKIVAL